MASLRNAILATLLALLSVPLAAQERRGFLYEACRDQRCLLLMGTIHVGRAEWYPLPAAQQAKLDGATRIVLEADVSRLDAMNEALLRYGLYPPGPGLDAVLPSELRSRVERAFKKAGIAPEQAWRMKPWLLASALALSDAGAAGLGTEASSESWLRTQARGRSIAELEGVLMQFRFFDSAPLEVQLAYLDETLEAFDSGEQSKEFDRIARAWESGDEDALAELLEAMASEPGRGAKFAVETLINARNLGMLEGIEREFGAGGLPLIAVGALHLPGPQGLVSLLRSRGFSVKRI